MGSEWSGADSECFSVFPMNQPESDGKGGRSEQRMEGTPNTNRTSGKNPLLMRGQSETFIYHQGCVDVRPVSAELTEGKRASEGQQTMLKESCLRRLA